MATKASTIYSTNPKMDTSGIKAKMPQFGYDMSPLPPKEIAGGKLYMKALREEEDFSKAKAITTTPKLKQAAKLVSGGMSPYMAMEVVSREEMDMGGSSDSCSDWE
jgi:hypothetical protein